MSTWRFALLLCLSGLSFAQTPSFSVSPTEVNYRLRSPHVYPTWRYMAPAKQVLEVTAAPGQAWTVQVSGDLSTACLYSSACFVISDEHSNQAISAGVGPQRVAVNWYPSQVPDLEPGQFEGVVSFFPMGGGPTQVVTVHLNVLSAAELPAAAEMKATALYENGCVASDPALSYTYAVRCAIPLEAPIYDPALTQPPVGHSFIDPTFGAKITRITGSGCSTEYGTTTAFSARNTYIWTSCGIYRRSDLTLVRGPRDSLAVTALSASDDEVYYHFQDAKLLRYNFVTDTDELLADFSAAPYGFDSVSAGGTAPVSSDEWIAFYDSGSSGFPKVCAVDLAALRMAGVPGPSNTYCTSYQGERRLNFLDWVAVAERDDTTGKRYVYLSAIPVSTVFFVGEADSGQLQQDYLVPEQPGWAQNNDDGNCSAGEVCYSASNFTHIALMKDRDGQVKVFGNHQDILLVRDYNSLYRLNAGAKIFRLDVEGGGQTILGRTLFDKQPGCSPAIQGCTASYVEVGIRYAARVTAMEPMFGSTRLTLSAPPGWELNSSHDVRVQNGVGSWNCVNGKWTASVVSATVLDVPAICIGASGDFSHVLLGDASQPFSGNLNDNRGQLHVLRPGRQVHRVAMHRSVVWNDIPGTGVSVYGTTPRASISRDGSLIAFNSNWGSLDFDGESVYIVETSLGASESKITIKNVEPATNAAALNYDIPNGQACSIELSGDPTFSSPLETVTDSAGSVTRSTYLGRTVLLQPSTRYWIRMQCGLEVESQDFRTMPAVTATPKALTTDVGASEDSSVAHVMIEYRTAGESNFTSTSPQACATGCQVTWTGMAGTVSEYRIVYLDATLSAISTTDTRALTVAVTNP
ncbi:MAG: hypothetical protein ABL995_16125 [Bryobacteraceae bacterium]